MRPREPRGILGDETTPPPQCWRIKGERDTFPPPPVRPAPSRVRVFSTKPKHVNTLDARWGGGVAPLRPPLGDPGRVRGIPPRVC